MSVNDIWKIIVDNQTQIITGLFTLAGAIIGFGLTFFREVIEEKKTYNRLIDNIHLLFQDWLDFINKSISDIPSDRDFININITNVDLPSTLTYEILRKQITLTINPEQVKICHDAFEKAWDVKNKILTPLGGRSFVVRV